MKKYIKFHLDESVSNAIAQGLRRRGIDVTTTNEKNLMSASDLEQITLALCEQRVIVTHDDDFTIIHNQGTSHAGIAYCNQNYRSIGEIINTLTLIWESLESEDMKNQLEFL